MKRGYRDPATGRVASIPGTVSVTALARAAAPAVLRGQLELAQKALADACGFHVFEGLYEGDRRVAARLVEGKFGWSWLVRPDEAERFGRKWIPFAGPRPSTVQAGLGLTERLETAQAEAVITADRFGNDRVRHHRTGDKWGQDSVLKREAE